MALIETTAEKTARLETIIRPYLLQLLKDAPSFGEISFSATLHGGDIGRVKLGAEVSRVVAPQSVESP
jgi:hypothetical protein